MSFYSRDLYREAARGWKGIGVLYLLLLLALSWLPSSVRMFSSLRAFSRNEGRQLVDRLPTIRISQGEMLAEPQGRHVIPVGKQDDEYEGKMVLIIDDTIDRVPSSETAAAIILTRREFGMIQPNKNERRIWQLTPGADMEVTPADVQSFLGALPFWAVPLGYCLCVAWTLGFRTVQVLLYALIGRTWARRRNSGLDYRSLVRLSALAVTPAIVVRTLLWFGPWEPAWYLRWPVAIAISLAYLAFGIRAAVAENTAGAPVTAEHTS